MPPSITQTVVGLAAAYFAGSLFSSLLGVETEEDREVRAQSEAEDRKERARIEAENRQVHEWIDRQVREWMEAAQDREIRAWIEGGFERVRVRKLGDTGNSYSSGLYRRSDDDWYLESVINTLWDGVLQVNSTIKTYEALGLPTEVPEMQRENMMEFAKERICGLRNPRAKRKNYVHSISRNDATAPPPYSLNSSTSASTKPVLCTCCLPPSAEDFDDDWAADDWMEDDSEEDDEFQGWSRNDNVYTGTPRASGSNAASLQSSTLYYRRHDTHTNSRTSDLSASIDKVSEERRQKLADIERRFALIESYRPLTYEEKESKRTQKENVMLSELEQSRRLGLEQQATQSTPLMYAGRRSSEISAPRIQSTSTVVSGKPVYTSPGTSQPASDGDYAAKSLRARELHRKIRLLSQNQTIDSQTPDVPRLNSSVSDSTSSKSVKLTPGTFGEDPVAKAHGAEERLRLSLKRHTDLLAARKVTTSGQILSVYTPPITQPTGDEDRRAAKAARAKQLLPKRELNKLPEQKTTTSSQTVSPAESRVYPATSAGATSKPVYTSTGRDEDRAAKIDNNTWQWDAALGEYIRVYPSRIPPSRGSGSNAQAGQASTSSFFGRHETHTDSSTGDPQNLDTYLRRTSSSAATPNPEIPSSYTGASGRSERGSGEDRAAKAAPAKELLRKGQLASQNTANNHPENLRRDSFYIPRTPQPGSQEGLAANDDTRTILSKVATTQNTTTGSQISPAESRGNPATSVSATSKPAHTPPRTLQLTNEEDRAAKAARAKELLRRRRAGDNISSTSPYTNIPSSPAEIRNTISLNPTAAEFQSRLYLVTAKRESGSAVNDVKPTSRSFDSLKVLKSTSKNMGFQRVVQYANSTITSETVNNKSISEPSTASGRSSVGRSLYIPPAKRISGQDKLSPQQPATTVNELRQDLNTTSQVGPLHASAIASDSNMTVNNVPPPKATPNSNSNMGVHPRPEASASVIPPIATPHFDDVNSHYVLVLEAAQATVTALDKMGIKCALFGSLAANLYGAERIPKDVDLLTFPTPENSMDSEQIKDHIVSLDSRFYLKKSANPKNTYRILWFNSVTGKARNKFNSNDEDCKVDILIPGIMSLPDVAGKDDTIRWLMPDPTPYSTSDTNMSLPVLPFPIVLLHKLQGWSDHRVAREHFKRKRQGQDAADVASLLSIHSETDNLASQMSYASPSHHNPNLWIPALTALWMNPTWFPTQFQMASKRRVRLFCYYFPEWKSHWKRLGFETEPREGEVEREKKQVVSVGGDPGDTSK